MSALALRTIACICMILDHVGFCFKIPILRYIGRLAFPIYVFLMVNGFRYTKNRVRYGLRLALFAVLSQIPFTLMCYNRIFDSRMNVMVTLLLGLLVIWAGETMRQHKQLRYIWFLPALLIYGACCFGLIQADYDKKGILMAVVFWYFYDKKLWMILGTFLSIWLHYILYMGFAFLWGREVAPPTLWQMAQTLAVLALPLIFLYNDRPGKLPESTVGKKTVQYAFYWFYPVHMLILWFLFLR